MSTHGTRHHGTTAIGRIQVGVVAKYCFFLGYRSSLLPFAVLRLRLRLSVLSEIDPIPPSLSLSLSLLSPTSSPVTRLNCDSSWQLDNQDYAGG